jgi:RNA polymerase sigma-70 factor (ECF subfamily)
MKPTKPEPDARAPHPDRVLALRASEGDERAWRQIYDATRERLFALLVYQIGNRDEALDVLQDTYLHAFKGLAAYEGRSSLESWLSGIAIRRALDWKRRLLGRFKRTSSIDEVPLSDEREPQADPDEGRRLRHALERLPQRQRSALVLHEWMGYAFAEIGQILGVSEATARVHAFRARDALRALLTEPAAALPAAVGLPEDGHERAL